MKQLRCHHNTPPKQTRMWKEGACIVSPGYPGKIRSSAVSVALQATVLRRDWLTARSLPRRSERGNGKNICSLRISLNHSSALLMNCTKRFGGWLQNDLGSCEGSHSEMPSNSISVESVFEVWGFFFCLVFLMLQLEIFMPDILRGPCLDYFILLLS